MKGIGRYSWVACSLWWDDSTELLGSEECYAAVKCLFLFDFESGLIQTESILFSTYYSLCGSIVMCLSLNLLSFFSHHLHPLDIEGPFCPLCCQSGCVVWGCWGDFVLDLSESVHLGDTRTWGDWRQIGRSLCVAVWKHLAWCDMMLSPLKSYRHDQFQTLLTTQSVGCGEWHCKSII